jgi:hypothetical protein
VPEQAPPVFVDDRLLFYALLDETMPFDHTTTVELFAGAQEHRIGMARIDYVPPVLESQAITRLAAKARLRELLYVQEPIDKETFVNLSIKYGILCPHTAFIGVEKRLNANHESNIDMELREVPIMIDGSCRNTLTHFRTISSAYPQSYQSLSSAANNAQDIMRDNIQYVLRRACKIDDLEDQTCKIDDLEDQACKINVLSDQAYRLQCESSSFYFASGRMSQKKGFNATIKSVTAPLTNFFSSLLTRKTTENHVPSSDSVTATNSTSSNADQLSHNSCSSNSQASEVTWPTDEQKLVYRFIDLQQYDGLWMLTANDVKQLTGKSLTVFSSSAVENIENNEQQLIITTAIVIVILEARCLSTKTLWQALSNKAHKRLKELLNGDDTKVEQLMKDIRDQIQ